MKALILGGAPIEDYGFCQDYLPVDYVVCCDNGMTHAKALGLKPDVIVGDFDSVPQEVLESFLAQQIPIRQFSPQKDETDMELGLDAALEAGATEVVLFGGIGRRLDHTIANCHYLEYLLHRGVAAKLVDSHNVVQLTGSELHLTGETGRLVSTLPLTKQVTGITTTGLAYPLTDGTLTRDGRLIAVSNVMLGQEAEIRVKSGLLLVIQSRD